ncbi:protein CEBPZOS isoform X2 [Rhinatrema bivittatum]|uniref:protein CEBPZOS isoform X2 n=1 Tax=Rhinatrema bivittatum TaxID=194408 RepID=UPI001128D219|nr:protein CEBPZOS isoform X2 [Rhinatrema bivittatum]
MCLYALQDVCRQSMQREEEIIFILNLKFRKAPVMESSARKILKGIVLLEVAGVFGAYYLYHKMNTSQDFRHTMNRNWPSILEAFYKSNEWAGIHGIREKDKETWSRSGN